jgi:hypothetical protein
MIGRSSSGGLSAMLAVASALVAGSPASRAADAAPRQAYRINDTGLTRCTRDFRTLTHDCAGTGQDAETGRDVAKPADRDGHAGFSFVKVCNSGELAGSGTCSPDAALGPGADDWGCVHDRITGLEWELKTTDGSERDQDHHFVNAGDGAPGDASAYVAAMNSSVLCGHADWRLPTTNELFGIDDFDRPHAEAAVDPAWFPNTRADWYWAAEGYFRFADTEAWAANFSSGDDQGLYARLRTTASLVRLVRAGAGHAAPAQRHAPDASGEQVADHVSHLVWRRCVEGESWEGTTCTGRPQRYKLTEAIARAQHESARTGLPWRLPNIKELHMLVDETRVPSIDPETFPRTPTGRHWSSTLTLWNPYQFWTVEFFGGEAESIFSSNAFYVRLVRDDD